jgi:hypothetical protein
MILKPYALGASLKPYGYDLDAFPFDDAYLDKLLGFLGRNRAEVDLHDFAQDHFNLLYAFIQARKIEAETPSITQETKALAKAQDAAWALAAALKTVRDTGEAGKRLIEDSAILPDRRFAMNDLTLAELLAGPDHNPHVPFRALLFDLRVALQRAKIEKPRKLLPIIDGPDTSAKTRDDRRVRFAAQDDDPEGRYRARLSRHGLVANSALAHFAADLWDMWPRYSDRPFTEGRYEGKGIGNNSATLDFAETCLKAFGANYRRSLIAQKLRDARALLPFEAAQ